MTETLDKWKGRAAAAESNRAAMPVVTAYVDALRQHFPGAKVTYAREALRELGARDGRVGVVAVLEMRGKVA